MSLRQTYGSESVDLLLRYFMKTILHVKKRGSARIPVDITLGEPADAYLRTAMDLIEDAQPPEVFDVILRVEFERIRAQYGADLGREQVTLLVLTGELSRHIRFDADPTEYLLSTGNLWNDGAMEYAMKTFYPNLPLETRIREGMEDILQKLPEEFFRPDDF